MNKKGSAEWFSFKHMEKAERVYVYAPAAPRTNGKEELRRELSQTKDVNKQLRRHIENQGYELKAVSGLKDRHSKRIDQLMSLLTDRNSQIEELKEALQKLTDYVTVKEHGLPGSNVKRRMRVR